MQRPRFPGNLLAILMVLIFSGHLSGTSDTPGGIVEYPSLNVSICLSSPVQVLLMECTNGHMVRLVRIFYGRSQQRRCGFTEDDCTMDLPNSENFMCIGKSNCQIHLTPDVVGRTIPKCGQVSTYAQAMYQCIPGSASVNMCEKRFETRQQGFIQTPDYPQQNYPNGLDCNFTIVAPYEDQRIGLYAIDFQLEANGTGCSDWIELFDGYKSNTLCGQRSRIWLLNSTHQSLHIRFYSSQKFSQKGFWLYFHVFPFRALTTTSTTTTTTTKTTGATTTLIALPISTRFSSIAYKSIPSISTAAVNELDGKGVFLQDATYSDWHPEETDEHVANQVIYVSENVTPFPTVSTALFLGVAIGLILSALLVIVIIIALKSFLPVRRLPSSECRINIESKNNVEKEAMTLAGNILLTHGADPKRNRTPQSVKRPLRNLCSPNYFNETVANNNYMNV